MRCSALRPVTPKSERSGGTRCTRLSAPEAGQGALASGGQHQTGVDRKVAYLLEIISGIQAALVEEGVDDVAHDLELDQPAPGGVDRVTTPVVLGGDAGDRRIEAQRQVLADQRDVHAFTGEIGGDGQDAAVVRIAAQARRQGGQIAVVHLHPQRAAGVVDRDRLGELAVLDA